MGTQELVDKQTFFLLREAAHKRFLCGLNLHYKDPDGDYCVYPQRTSRLETWELCNACGAACYIEVIRCGAYQHGGPIRETVFCGVNMNSWQVCKDRRCRALAAFYPYPKFTRPTIAKVILEVIKHGGDNEHKRRLEKHFVRGAG